MEADGQEATAGDEASQARARFARVRLLSDELDKLMSDASERSESVNSRASFLAVAAGVLVAAATAQLWTQAEFVGIVALALASIGLLCAAVALRPAKRPGLIAQRLVDRYFDSRRSALEMEAEIVQDKASVISARESDMRSRAAWIVAGFFALASGTIALTVVYALEVIGT